MTDTERIRLWLASLLLRRILPIVIVITCLLGMGLMLTKNFRQGLSLWFIAMVAGALTLYVRRTLEKKLRDLLEEIEAERARTAEADVEEAKD